MLTLALLLALDATPESPQARGTALPPAAERSTERCPDFRDAARPVAIEQCDLVESGEIAVIDGDRYFYRLYCIDEKGSPVPLCGVGRGSRGATVLVRRRGETALRLIHKSFVISGEIRRPTIVANRYGHILELPTVVSPTCECNASRYFLKRTGSREWRELDFEKWHGELTRRLPDGLTNMNVPWPDLGSMRITGALWRRADAHCCPAGGQFTGELAIEGRRFVLRSITLELADEKP